jgi:hypothetical protein
MRLDRTVETVAHYRVTLSAMILGRCSRRERQQTTSRDTGAWEFVPAKISSQLQLADWLDPTGCPTMCIHNFVHTHRLRQPVSYFSHARIPRDRINSKLSKLEKRSCYTLVELNIFKSVNVIWRSVQVERAMVDQRVANLQCCMCLQTVFLEPRLG